MVCYIVFLWQNKFISRRQLTTTSNELNSTKVALDKKTTDDANTITQMKADHNAENQKNQNDILKLTGERDSALTREKFLESLPQTALTTYSNAQALAFQNRLNVMPNINGSPFTNYIFGDKIFIPITNRTISIEIPHLPSGSNPAENLTISLVLPMDETNICSGISPGLWSLKGAVVRHSDKPNNNFEITSQAAITEVRGFVATSLEISTNFNTKAFTADIEIYAPGLIGAFGYTVNFIMQ